MFLEKLCQENPEFIEAVTYLHQKRLLKSNSYILDYDTIKGNLTQLDSEAKKYNLSIYPMTKQIGRHPVIIKLLAEQGLNKIVAVDWLGAKGIAKYGGIIGHIGHLVQVPVSETRDIVELRPEVWTVFSLEKAEEINSVLRGNDYIQEVLLRVWTDGDQFYTGHAGGIKLERLVDTARKINTLSNIKVVGVTSFPCLLFDEASRDIYTTPNLETIVKAAEMLEDIGFEIKQINGPGTTSATTMEMLAEKGVTHVEPGHGMTGTTPLHRYRELPEKPAVLYLSEISHFHKQESYFFGGGLYIDPVIADYPIKCLIGNSENTILQGRYPARWIDPGGIDYYGMAQTKGENFKSGDTVILGFRVQAFVTRANITVISRDKKKGPIVLG